MKSSVLDGFPTDLRSVVSWVFCGHCEAVEQEGTMPTSPLRPRGAKGHPGRAVSRQHAQQPSRTIQDNAEKQKLFEIERDERRRLREILRLENLQGQPPRMKTVPAALCERVAASMRDTVRRELAGLPGRLAGGGNKTEHPLFLTLPYLEDICRLRPLKPSCFRRAPAVGRREREQLEAVQRERDRLHSQAAANFAEADLPTAATVRTLVRKAPAAAARGHARPLSAPPGSPSLREASRGGDVLGTLQMSAPPGPPGPSGRTHVAVHARPHSAGADREEISAQPRGGAGPRWRPQTAGALGRGEVGGMRSARPLGEKERAVKERADAAWARAPAFANILRKVSSSGAPRPATAPRLQPPPVLASSSRRTVPRPASSAKDRPAAATRPAPHAHPRPSTAPSTTTSARPRTAPPAGSGQRGAAGGAGQGALVVRVSRSTSASMGRGTPHPAAFLLRTMPRHHWAYDASRSAHVPSRPRFC